MYELMLDCIRMAVLIPKAGIEAIGSPGEVTFLFNREKAVLAIASGPVEILPPEGYRGRPQKFHGVNLDDIWDEESGFYIVEHAYNVLEAFSRMFFDFDFGKVYLLRGDFIGPTILGFDLTTADVTEEAPPEDPSDKRQKYSSREEEKEAIRKALRDHSGEGV